VVAWLTALARIVYDKELAISERRVSTASIIHNSSLILGKKIIHILPEGHVSTV
jgi:nucleoporin POM152